MRNLNSLSKYVLLLLGFFICIVQSSDPSSCFEEQEESALTGKKITAQLEKGFWDGSCSQSSMDTALQLCSTNVTTHSSQAVKLACRILLDKTFIPFGFFRPGMLLDQPLSEIDFESTLATNVFGTCELLNLIHDSCFYYQENIAPASFTFLQYVTDKEYEDTLEDQWALSLSYQLGYSKTLNTSYTDKVAIRHSISASLNATLAMYNTNVSYTNHTMKSAFQRMIWQNQIGKLNVDSCFLGNNTASKRYISPEFLSYIVSMENATSIDEVISNPAFSAVAAIGSFVPTIFRFATQYAATLETKYNAFSQSSKEKMKSVFSLTAKESQDSNSQSAKILQTQQMTTQSEAYKNGLSPNTTLTITQVGICDTNLFLNNPDNWDGALKRCAMKYSGDVDLLPSAASVPATGFRHITEIVSSAGVNYNPMIYLAWNTYYSYCTCDGDNLLYYSCFAANGTLISATPRAVPCLNSYWLIPYFPSYSYLPPTVSETTQIRSSNGHYVLAFDATRGTVTLYQNQTTFSTMWLLCLFDCLKGKEYKMSYGPQVINGETFLNGVKSGQDIKLATTTSLMLVSSAAVYLNNNGLLELTTNHQSMGTFTYGLQNSISNPKSYLPSTIPVSNTFSVTSPSKAFSMTFTADNGQVALHKIVDGKTSLMWLALAPEDSEIEQVYGYRFDDTKSDRIDVCIHGLDANSQIKESCNSILTLDSNSVNCQIVSTPLTALTDDGKFHFVDGSMSSPCGNFDLNPNVIEIEQSSEIPRGDVNKSFSIISPRNMFKLTYSAASGMVMMYAFNASSSLETPVWYKLPDVSNAVEYVFRNDNLGTISTVAKVMDGQGQIQEHVYSVMDFASNSSTCDNGRIWHSHLNDDGTLSSFLDEKYCGRSNTYKTVNLVSQDSLMPRGTVSSSFVVTAPKNFFKMAYSAFDGTFMLYHIHNYGTDTPVWKYSPDQSSFSSIQKFSFTNDNLTTLSSNIHGLDASGVSLQSSSNIFEVRVSTGLCGSGARVMHLSDDGELKSFLDGELCDTFKAVSDVVYIPDSSMVPVPDITSNIIIESPNKKYKLAFAQADGTLMMYDTSNDETPVWYATPRDWTISQVTGYKLVNNVYQNRHRIETCLFGNASTGVPQTSCYLSMQETSTTGWCDSTNAQHRMQLQDDGTVSVFANAIKCGTLAAAPPVKHVPMNSIVPISIKNASKIISPNRKHKLAFAIEDGTAMMYQIDANGDDIPLWYATPRDWTIANIHGYELITDIRWGFDRIETCVYGDLSSGNMQTSCYLIMHQTENTHWCDNISAQHRMLLQDDGTVIVYANGVKCGVLTNAPAIRLIPSSSLVPVGATSNSFELMSPNNKYKLKFFQTSGELGMYRVDSSSSDTQVWYVMPRDSNIVSGFHFNFASLIYENSIRLEVCEYGLLSTGESQTSCFLSMQQTINSGFCTDNNVQQRMFLQDDGTIIARADAVYCGIVEVAPGATFLNTLTPTTAPTMGPTTAPTTGPTTAPTMGSTTSPTIAPTASPTIAPTASPTTAPTPSPSCSNGRYDQCGGAGFTGEACCDEGLLCTHVSDMYSQCDPDSARTCILENDPCIDSPTNCCGSLTCQGDQFYKSCTRA